MSSDQRELMQNQSFPSNANVADHLKHSQPIPSVGGHQRFPQPNNNNMGNPPGVQISSHPQQNFGNQGVHNLQALMTDPQFFQKFSENFNSISHIHQMAASIQMPAAGNQHHGVLPTLQKLTTTTSSLSSVQNQAMKSGNVMNFGGMRQFSPPKASHPQLKTTPTTSKPPQLAGNNIPNKSQLQPSETATVAPLMSSPSQPASSQQPTTPQKQQTANNSQNKNVPSPQNPAVAISSPSTAKKSSPMATSTGATVQTTQKIQNPPQASSSVTNPPKSLLASQTTPTRASNPTSAVIPAASPIKPNENTQSSVEIKVSESPKVAPIVAPTSNKNVPLASNPPATKPIIESDKTPTKSITIEQPKIAKAAPTTPTKAEEKKSSVPAAIVTTPKSTVVADKQQLSPSIPKSSMRLATVTPPRHKKPPPTRKSATGVEKQPPIRVNKPTIAAAQKSPAIPPRVVAAASTPIDTSPKVKRSRVQVQPYQCPTRNLELATKLSTKIAYPGKKETEQEKLIIFYK